MSTDELDAEEVEKTDADPEIEDQTADESPDPLKLEIAVQEPNACQRHVTVTIPREDIDRYYDDAFSEMMESAAVPGFRVGRAPRKLIESRFRKDVKDQVKGSLLMDSMAQVNEEQEFAAISEPELDLEAIDVPDEGAMKFEFKLEVRPEFDVPDWKGLSIERPEAEFSDKEIDKHQRRALESYGRRVPSSDPAEEGDYLTINVTVSDGDDTVNEVAEQSICIRPTLSFRDGKIEKFDKLMKGVKSGESREAEMQLSGDAQNEELAGKKVSVKFEVLDVKTFEPPELTKDLLDELGGFDGEGELRDAIKDNLQRQLDYDQQQRAREQITKTLTEAASWELPPDLLTRQSNRELQRAVLELRRSGFAEADIQAYANDLRQNSQEKTAQALREHFILERIAEDEDIEADDDDFDAEISLLALQGGESPRRVRARIEKDNLMDALRNQIIERKVIDAVLEKAKFKKTKFKAEGGDIEALDVAAAGGEEKEIPVAEHGELEALVEPTDHT
jgi:trigger factor